METKNKKQTVKTEKQNKVLEQRPKSRFTLWREKHPEGIGEIVNMRAVLK
jgi:hypothetical protein